MKPATRRPKLPPSRRPGRQKRCPIGSPQAEQGLKELLATRECIACGRPASRLGTWEPTPAASLAMGVEPGRRVAIAYMLCRSCAPRLLDLMPRIEARITAGMRAELGFTPDRN